MTKFFDFLYYSIFKFYSKKEKGASSSSAGIVGGLQAMNILTIFMLMSVLLHKEDSFNKLIVIIVFIVFQITTYIRYVYKEDNSVIVIEEQWLHKSESEKKRINQYIALYIILSILLFLGVAIFIGSRKH